MQHVIARQPGLRVAHHITIIFITHTHCIPKINIQLKHGDIATHTAWCFQSSPRNRSSTLHVLPIAQALHRGTCNERRQRKSFIMPSCLPSFLSLFCTVHCGVIVHVSDTECALALPFVEIGSDATILHILNKAPTQVSEGDPQLGNKVQWKTIESAAIREKREKRERKEKGERNEQKHTVRPNALLQKPS